jgi:hypothetical protein
MAEIEIPLTDASVEVNDESVTIENGSLVIMEGQGEVNVRTASKGGRPVVVPSEDISTKVGQVKFEVPTSVFSMNFFKDVKARAIGSNTIRVSGLDSNGNRLGRTLSLGSMVNDPEKAIQTEGKFPVEFKGAPLAAS